MTVHHQCTVHIVIQWIRVSIFWCDNTPCVRWASEANRSLWWKKVNKSKTSLIDLFDEHTHAYTLFLIVRFDWKIVSTVYYRIATLSCSWLCYLLLNLSFDAISGSILFFLRNYNVLLSRFKNVVRIMMLDLRYCITLLITLHANIHI